MTRPWRSTGWHAFASAWTAYAWSVSPPVGAEALDQAAARAPDVVLLDITMPDMDGLETARRLRALADPPAIIFTTAHEEFAIDAFAIEAVHYLLKPVLRGQLEEALLRVRQHRTKAAEPARSLGEIWVSRGYELIRLELASVESYRG